MQNHLGSKKENTKLRSRLLMTLLVVPTLRIGSSCACNNTAMSVCATAPLADNKEMVYENENQVIMAIAPCDASLSELRAGHWAGANEIGA